ncbi:hypothetical protein DZC75_23030 [Pseudomonas parafulva]|uniref:Uncharacterized protein YtcA n=1 Tax=Pseudomonas parafulva TaxID=157782 RepID=A0AAI8PDG1_9PSED|nr:YtcA family lipoprotein [Pseudomonas parafulva]AXO90734.1 hypothetical protein DZC75_23030 [Pseudomonas parafulva]
MAVLEPDRAVGMLCIGTLLSGCTQSPALPVFGAIFPDWLFAIIAGVIITILLHVMLSKARALDRLQPLAVTYPALAALSAMLVWLIVFHP